MNQATATAEKDVAPTPTFDTIPLGSEVRKAIDALGYVHPTPVQLAVFEPASRGKSLVVQARTGTGKTAAFGLPIVDNLVKRSQHAVQALILTPTRELALQVARELERIAQFRGTKVVAIYGGAPMGRQITALEEGAQVVVGTPGRVLDHLRRGTLDASGIRIFVLDEADEMLSMGFQKELNAIIEMLPKDRQGLYFSATIPADVERLATNHLRDPEYVTLSSDQIGALEISHFVYLVREGDKRGALARIIEVEDPESAVVFCNTKDETERVAEALKSRGYDADWLNGDLEQRERERVMAKTREGKLRFLVATDVAARGIDISHLTHVINADFPESAEQYVHRTGRTGRAGRTGTAISMVGPKDVGHLYMLRLTYKIRPIERMLPTQGELRTRAEADMIAFLADAYAGKTQDPQHLAIARRLLTADNAEVVIAGLLADHLGASSQDAAQEAADARRGRNPPPVPQPGEQNERPARRGDEREPRTLREGDKLEDRSRERPPHRERDRDRTEYAARGGGERRPHSTLASWEPTPETDDDAPLFREDSTRPGLGGPPPPEPRGERIEQQPRRDRDRDRDRGRGRGRASGPSARTRDVEATADTKAFDDSGRPTPRGMPSYRVEGERPEPPTSHEEERGVPDSLSPPSRDDRREEHGDDPAFTNVFLNVGRRDGLRAEDVQRLLVEKAGLSESDVGHIRLRDRITFVGIRKEQSDRAIKALAGVVIGDRTVNAEPARDR